MKKFLAHQLLKLTQEEIEKLYRYIKSKRNESVQKLPTNKSLILNYSIAEDLSKIIKLLKNN